MTATSNSLQQSSYLSKSFRTVPWESNLAANSYSTGSDSSSDDSSKLKRRSHRPRGCRGGGSRRARKERRELQFLALKQQQEMDQKLMLPPLKDYVSLQDPAKQSRQHVFRDASELPPLLSLPTLQSSSSFSSSECSDLSDVYFAAKNRVTNFNILPSMPTSHKSKSANGGNAYRTMAALPPLPPAAGCASYDQLATKQDSSYNTNSYNNGSSAPSQTPALKTCSLSIDVRSKATANATTDSLQEAQTKAPPQSSLNAAAASFVSPKSLIPATESFPSIHDNRSICSGHHTIERIKMQQDILAGGGSFFATSPKSFLLGIKKGPTYCF